MSGKSEIEMQVRAARYTQEIAYDMGVDPRELCAITMAYMAGCRDQEKVERAKMKDVDFVYTADLNTNYLGGGSLLK